GHDLDVEVLRNLPGGDPRDVAGGLPERPADVGGNARSLRFDLGARHFERSVEAVEAPRKPEQRPVALLADPRDDAGDAALEGAVHRLVAGEHPRQRPPVRRVDDLHHSTILFNGYSTIPCARAAFSRGIRSRTVRSSMIVFTATHSSSLRAEIVGRCSAG